MQNILGNIVTIPLQITSLDVTDKFHLILFIHAHILEN